MPKSESSYPFPICLERQLMVSSRDSNEKSSVDRLIVNGLLRLGLAELPTIRKYDNRPELETPVADDYTSKTHFKPRTPVK
jgi:hypothetical protein